MRKHTPKSRKAKIQNRLSEVNEIELLEAWIESGKPESGSNPLSLDPLPHKGPVGRLTDCSFSSRLGQRVIHKMGSYTGYWIVVSTRVEENGKYVLEKLYKARWGPEDGVGCIIMSPTRELAGQLFEVLKSVGKHHGFSAGLLIGGRKDVDAEKEHVNVLNILVCTPGRLLQHMDETPNFDCSQLQVLVLDEADRILDVGFKKDLNAIISQLPKHRQTLLFSATQTKSVQDLARLSLKDPEYLGVHEESDTATPNRLQQTAMLVPLDKKLDMLWSFIKAHLNSRILVFLSSCKQVKFVFETFKKLRPGIPLKCLHGRMKQDRRMGIYSQFCEQRSVLFSTDVASRGLDFNKAVDWVVQVDCPEDCAAYIHRVGRTARYLSGGRSVLFVMPSEMKMLEKLEEKKIPLRVIKKLKGKTVSEALSLIPENTSNENLLEFPVKKPDIGKSDVEEVEEEDLLLAKETQEAGEKINSKGDDMLATRVTKKKKLKINVHRPVGTRVVFDEEGNTLPPLARLAATSSDADSVQLNKEKVNQRYAELRKNLKVADKEDKDLDKKRRKEKRIKEKMKYKRGREDEEEEDEDVSGSDAEIPRGRVDKKTKIYFDSDDEDGERTADKAKEGIAADSISLAEQEELALKLLNSMHS
ncbi:hypothetical protein RND71_037664 [Anisodus tanguticus]|uniref:ATP-dependent RNA helicase n=1 Tax=Anisodus tanguticus TaxID=243964 RepID=A0AAE1QYH2_9SOLA|nr:hypothetical protein RND71_037664 [Anisodus tanguticus]